MAFCPEWLTGSLVLNISDALDIWVYFSVSPYSLTCFNPCGFDVGDVHSVPQLMNVM